MTEDGMIKKEPETCRYLGMCRLDCTGCRDKQWYNRRHYDGFESGIEEVR